MECSDVQDQLSAYFDGEVTSEGREFVSRHLEHCQTCAAEFAVFRKISIAFNRVQTPQVPPSIWTAISATLNKSPAQAGNDRVDVRPQRMKSQTRFSTVWQRWALAATIVVLMGSGIWVIQHHQTPTSEHMHSADFVAAMDRYLTTLATDPDAAEQFLAHKYDGKVVDSAGAVKLLGYSPAVTNGLPEEYTLASTSVLKMPCCTCVKAVCQRRDGSTLVLFEHDDEKTNWFGDRPSNTAMCGDKECCLVDLDSNIAATWKRGSRSITAVGARDKGEVNTLVSWLDKSLHTTL